MSRNITERRLMPAQNTTTNPVPKAGRNDGEEVNAMGFKRSKRQAGRAWDEMSATDRAVLLEAVRQRREQMEQRRSVIAGLNQMRHVR